MKTIIASLVLLFSAQSFAAPAASFEGEYQVVKGCKPNNSRLAVLELMYHEGVPVSVKVDAQKELLLFTAEHNTLALPFSSETELHHMIFEDYYKNADIRVSENVYGMQTKGSVWSTCDNYPLPGKRPCRRKWDDAVGMAVNAKGQLQIEWKIESTTGTCALERR